MEYNSTVSLPSCGKLGYPEEISLRPLRVDEIKKFSALLSDNPAAKLSELLRDLSDIADPDMLSQGDREHLILQIRVASGLGVIDVMYNCSSCGYENGKASVDLETIPVKQLEVEPYETLTVKDYTIDVRPVLGKDELLAYRLKKVFPKVDETYLTLLVTQVDQEAGMEAITAKLRELVAKPAGYALALEKELLTRIHGPIWGEATFACKECSASIPFPAGYIFSI